MDQPYKISHNNLKTILEVGYNQITLTWKPTTEPASGCVAGGKWQAFIESKPPPERLSSSSHQEFHDTDDMFSSWKNVFFIIIII